MGAILSWLKNHAWLTDNWFNLVQTCGIIGSIALTAAALRRDHRARRIGDLLTQTAHHRELWSELHRRPELSRIPHDEVDLIAQPVSVAEEEFLLLVIVHFHVGWMLAREGAFVTLDLLKRDAQTFFALPLPHVVWERTKAVRDPLFVRFIEKSVKPRKRLWRFRR